MDPVCLYQRAALPDTKGGTVTRQNASWRSSDQPHGYNAWLTLSISPAASTPTPEQEAADDDVDEVTVIALIQDFYNPKFVTRTTLLRCIIFSGRMSGLGQFLPPSMKLGGDRTWSDSGRQRARSALASARFDDSISIALCGICTRRPPQRCTPK
jgi:hypothetical protein